MPKQKIKTVTTVRLAVESGTFTLNGRDGAGREIEVELPVSALPRLAQEARRASLAAQARGVRLGGQGDWGDATGVETQAVQVGHFPGDPPSVALVFDPGTDNELAFRFPTEGARQLGQHIIAEADRLVPGAAENAAQPSSAD
jgi:hypothetical protein